MALFQITMGDYSVRFLLLFKMSLNFSLVWRSVLYNLSSFEQNGFYGFYGIGADFVAQYVDRYDGEYVRACHRAK